jgi:hypothetical protein
VIVLGDMHQRVEVGVGHRADHRPAAQRTGSPNPP